MVGQADLVKCQREVVEFDSGRITLSEYWDVDRTKDQE